MEASTYSNNFRQYDLVWRMVLKAPTLTCWMELTEDETDVDFVTKKGEQRCSNLPQSMMLKGVVPRREVRMVCSPAVFRTGGLCTQSRRHELGNNTPNAHTRFPPTDENYTPRSFRQHPPLAAAYVAHLGPVPRRHAPQPCRERGPAGGD